MLLDGVQRGAAQTSTCTNTEHRYTEVFLITRWELGRRRCSGERLGLAKLTHGLRQAFQRQGKHGEEPRHHGDGIVMHPGILRQGIQPGTPGKGLRELAEPVETGDFAGAVALQGSCYLGGSTVQ